MSKVHLVRINDDVFSILKNHYLKNKS